MEIVSIIKDSFQEYEGHQSLVLFSKGCNWNCSYCYNKTQVVDNPKTIGNVLKVIGDNINPLTDAVVFLGGEPTIWGADLVRACHYVKSLGLKTKLFTNGSNPTVVTKLINEGLLDALSVDFKAPMSQFHAVTKSNVPWDEFCDGFELIMSDAKEMGLDVEVRTTVFDELNMKGIALAKEVLFPDVRHICTPDFRDNIEKLKGEQN